MSEATRNGRSLRGQKASEGGRGNPQKTSSAAIERYLKRMQYPASKNSLVEKAKENQAPSDVMHILNQFDDKQYHSPIEVAKEVSRIE